MIKSYNKAFIFYFLMSLILLDFGNQIKKLSFNTFFNDYSNFIFSITHAKNTGAAFSLFQEHSFFLALIGILTILLITFYVYKNITFENKLELLSITLFTAGTCGNLIERLKFGYVEDYIKLNFINFPIFNIFDVMICFGLFLYFILLFWELKGFKNEVSNKSK